MVSPAEWEEKKERGIPTGWLPSFLISNSKVIQGSLECAIEVLSLSMLREVEVELKNYMHLACLIMCAA